jgi:hypothetical protein
MPTNEHLVYPKTMGALVCLNRPIFDMYFGHLKIPKIIEFYQIHNYFLINYIITIVICLTPIILKKITKLTLVCNLSLGTSILGF